MVQVCRQQSTMLTVVVSKVNFKLLFITTEEVSSTEDLHCENADKCAYWSDWGPCSQSCDGGTRTRTCSDSDAYVVGELGLEARRTLTTALRSPLNKRHQIIQTYITFCFPYLAYWSDWGPCSQSCDGGTRTRTCSDSDACSGSSSDSEDCNTQICPYWSDWGPCSQSCDGGTRTRTCSDSDAYVVGELGLEARRTLTTALRSPLNKRHQIIQTYITFCFPYLAYWSDWGPCSQSCDGGTRSRTCSDSDACSGSSSDSEDCNTQICPYWSAWSDWGPCSQSCDGGTRTRTCSDSNACSGSSSDSEDCNTQICPQAITWPMGTYGLLKPTTRCPNQWATGHRYHDTEDDNPFNAWSSPCHMSGPYDTTTNVYQNFCMKTVDIADTDDQSWPTGQYCIFRKGGSCPSGMTEGSVYWDNEDDDNANSYSGELPDGVYNIDTRIEFCCQTSGYTSNPIYLPMDTSFFLFKFNNECQQVHGMRATSEYFYWDTEDDDNDDEATGNHPYEGVVYSGIRLEFCYYERI
ncbi:uncharacterized protein [Amphiura filiformis]|uniref:uncharacterized protein n=1 Tax=Amphiura filiformis TaxID=82378 RepID=UPI003B225430